MRERERERRARGREGEHGCTQAIHRCSRDTVEPIRLHTTKKHTQTLHYNTVYMSPNIITKAHHEDVHGFLMHITVTITVETKIGGEMFSVKNSFHILKLAKAEKVGNAGNVDKEGRKKRCKRPTFFSFSVVLESTPHPPRNFSFSVLKLTDHNN